LQAVLGLAAEKFYYLAVDLVCLADVGLVPAVGDRVYFSMGQLQGQAGEGGWWRGLRAFL